MNTGGYPQITQISQMKDRSWRSVALDVSDDTQPAGLCPAYLRHLYNLRIVLSFIRVYLRSFADDRHKKAGAMHRAGFIAGEIGAV